MKQQIIACFILLIFTAILCSPLFISGIQPDGRYLINGGHDVLWHLALIKEITRQVPPQFPGIYDLPLQNYHYFTHLLLAIIPKLTGVSIPFLYFKIYNPLLVFGLTLIIFKLALQITKNSLKACLVTFVTLFSGSASFLLPALFGSKEWLGNSFTLDQPYDQLFNLHTTLGYILVFLSLFFLVQFAKEKKLSSLAYCALAVIFLVGVKSFFAIPLLVALLIFILLSGSIKLRHKCVFVLFLTATPYLLIKSISSPTSPFTSSLNFQPGWLLQKLIENSNRVYLQDLLLRQQYYLSVHNIPRLVQIVVYQILLYLLGNFWLRLLGLIALFKIKYFSREIRLFISTSIVSSLFLPILVTTNPDYFNTIQFGQVVILFLSFLTGIFLVSLSRRYVLITALICLVLPITFIHDFFMSRKYTDFYISADQIKTIDFIATNIPDDAVVLLNGDEYNMIIPGLAGRRTFYNGLKVAQLLGYEYMPYRQQNEDFFSGKLSIEDASRFLKNNKIDYIYTPPTDKTINTAFPQN